MDIEKVDTPQSERMDRFFELQAGQYWRAKDQINGEGIGAGEVLLVQSLAWADEAVHTVILRSHPDRFGSSGQVPYTDAKGVVSERWKSFQEHRFLLADFLDLFEPAHDHEEVRARELAAVQGKVNAVRDEIERFKTDPDMVEHIINEGLAEDAKKSGKQGTTLPALPPEVARAAGVVATGSISNALSGGMTEGKIDIIKMAAEREHALATVKARWISSKTKEIAETIKKMTPYYEEQAAAALAQTEDVRRYVARIIRGVETLDLYVGKNVDVETICKGVDADSSVPLTFAQQKLYMDEEMAVFTDVEHWFDFSKHETFFDALRKNDGLVSQIFPTERCVVVMATTRRQIEYGNVFETAEKNRLNRTVFLLVRNGENIHMVVSPVESHLGAAKLFPSKSDGDAIFTGIDGEQIGFDDVGFTDKLAKHENMAIHYKRFLILAAGLDHRLKLFGNFYDERDAFDFVSIGFQEKYCHFLFEDMTVVDGRLPALRAWVMEKNQYLRSGSRVACVWRDLITLDTAPGACEKTGRYGEYRIRFFPKNNVDVMVTKESNGEIVVTPTVHGATFRSQDRSFNARVSLSAFAPQYKHDEREIGYLCLDRVTPEELDHYVNNRSSRPEFLSYIKLFKQASAILKADRKAEASTRAALAEALSSGRAVDAADINTIIDAAIAVWRADHRGAALPPLEKQKSSKEWKGLLDLMYHMGNSTEAAISSIEGWANAEGLNPLRLTLNSSGKFVLYVEPLQQERDDRLEPFAWVKMLVVEPSGSGVSAKPGKWVVLRAADASEQTLKEWPAADSWISASSTFSNPNAKTAALSAFDTAADQLKAFSAPLEPAFFDDLYATWRSVRQASSKKRVNNPSFAIPFALRKSMEGTAVICAFHDYPHAILHELAPDDARRDLVRNTFIDLYADKLHASNRFKEDLLRAKLWEIRVTEDKAARRGGYVILEETRNYYSAGRSYSGRRVDPLLQPDIDKMMKEANTSFYFGSGMISETDRILLDDHLGLRRPEGYGPFKTYVTTAHDGKDETPSIFFDVHLHESGKEGLERLPGRPFVKTSSIGDIAATMEEAMRRLDNEAKTRGRRAVPASEVPDLEQPPEGVQRWYLVAE